MKQNGTPISLPRKGLTIRQHLFVLMLAFDTLFMMGLSWGIYGDKKRLLIADIDDTLRAVAVMAREVLPPDYHDRIVGPESVSDAEFQKTVDRFNRLCVALRLEYIWSLMIFDGRIVFTSSTSPDKVADNRKHAKFFEVHSNPELYTAAFDTMLPTFHTSHDKWGHVRVALIPGTDRLGRKYLFGSCVSLADVNKQLQGVLFQSLSVGAVLFIGLLLAGCWIAHVASKPIRRLTATIQAFANGDPSEDAEESGTYEIRTLAHHFNRLRHALQGKISDLEESREHLIGRHAEENKQAQDSLKSSEQRYRELMNFAVDGILIGTHEGIITDANECMCTLFGLKKEEIIGKHIHQMPFSPETLKENPFRFDLVHKGQTVVRERVIRRADASEVTVEIHSKIMPDGNLQSIYHDITERKRAEQSLSEAYAVLADAQHLARLGGWKYDVATRHVTWTEEVYLIFGVGKDFDLNDPEAGINLFIPEYRLLLRQAFQRAIERGEPYELELEFMRSDGEHVWVRTNCLPIVEGGRIVSLTGNILDITESKKARTMLENMNLTLEQLVKERTVEVQKYAEQLRVLTARMIRAEESERQRITNILHEDLQQILVASRMTLGAANEPATKKTGQDTLKRVDSMLSSAIQLTRSLIHEITVPSVKEGEVPVMLRWLSQEMKGKFDLTVDLVMDEDLEPVSESIYLCLYRALQEILFNVVKHAKVVKAEILVQNVANRFVRVTVKDAGDGFMIKENGATDTENGGIGLFGIRQRVEGLGGSMVIRSSTGQGTLIILTLPCKEAGSAVG